MYKFIVLEKIRLNSFASTHDEIVAKTTALEQLRSQNDRLRREISDI